MSGEGWKYFFFLLIFLNSRGNIFQRGSGVILMGGKAQREWGSWCKQYFIMFFKHLPVHHSFSRLSFSLCVLSFLCHSPFCEKRCPRRCQHLEKEKNNSPAHSTLTFLLSSLDCLLWLHIFPCSTFNILPFLPLFLSYPAFEQWIRHHVCCWGHI